MPGRGWVFIAIAAVVVLALLDRRMVAGRRTSRLRDRFGPEYDRTIGDSKNRREAEAALAEREKRRDSLPIVQLSAGARERYREQWTQLQAQFVDNPHARPLPEPEPDSDEPMKGERDVVDTNAAASAPNREAAR